MSDSLYKAPKTSCTGRYNTYIPGNGIIDHDLKGESGPDGTYVFKKYKLTPLKMSKKKLNWLTLYGDGTIAWDNMGFTEGMKPDRIQPFIEAAQSVYDYITQNDVVTRIGDINVETVIFPIIRKVIENSNSNLEDPEKFYTYCLDFTRNALPHYENIIEKQKIEQNDRPRPCIDIEAQLACDLSDNILKILKSNE